MAEEVKFTPWVAAISPEDGIRVLALDPRSTIICEVPAAASNKEAVKDAHLLAASPVLFEALEVAVAAMEESCRRFGRMNKTHAELSFALTDARQALSRARGGE